MTQAERDELRRLAEAANAEAPAPWQRVACDVEGFNAVVEHSGSGCDAVAFIEILTEPCVGEYAAAAHPGVVLTLLDLADECDRLRAERDDVWAGVLHLQEWLNTGDRANDRALQADAWGHHVCRWITGYCDALRDQVREMRKERKGDKR